MTREGARVYALEHCVFAANFPRWLTNITGNCPILEVRQYLIQNAFVEEVRDPTITTGHYESLVDFAVALGLDRDYIYNYQGAPITRNAHHLLRCEPLSPLARSLREHRRQRGRPRQGDDQAGR